METVNNNPHKNKVHWILAHSYSVYFVFFLIGVYLDLLFSTKSSAFSAKFLANSFMMSFGVILLIFASFLILWAQTTSRNIQKENLNKETFCRGPYCYTRNPTHWGLFLLLLGFGIMSNAFFVILSTLIAFTITKLTFLDKQEKILAQKYGSHYIEYKKMVRF